MYSVVRSVEGTSILRVHVLTSRESLMSLSRGVNCLLLSFRSSPSIQVDVPDDKKETRDQRRFQVP